MYKYLLFDLDGTLTESGEGIMNSAEYAFKAMGREVPDRDELRKFVGPPLAKSFPLYGFVGDEVSEAIRQFRVYFTDKGWKENRLYDGIFELCSRLKAAGYKLFVATSKVNSQAVRIMNYFGLSEFFEDTVGSDDVTLLSKEDVISYVLKKYGISESEAVMIGDRHYDIKGAAVCGLKAIGVTYGYGSRSELEEAGAIAVVDTVEELGNFFLEPITSVPKWYPF